MIVTDTESVEDSTTIKSRWTGFESRMMWSLLLTRYTQDCCCGIPYWANIWEGWEGLLALDWCLERFYELFLPLDISRKWLVWWRFDPFLFPSSSSLDGVPSCFCFIYTPRSEGTAGHAWDGSCDALGGAGMVSYRPSTCPAWNFMWSSPKNWGGLFACSMRWLRRRLGEVKMANAASRKASTSRIGAGKTRPWWGSLELIHGYCLQRTYGEPEEEF